MRRAPLNRAPFLSGSSRTSVTPSVISKSWSPHNVMDGGNAFGSANAPCDLTTSYSQPPVQPSTPVSNRVQIWKSINRTHEAPGELSSSREASSLAYHGDVRPQGTNTVRERNLLRSNNRSFHLDGFTGRDQPLMKKGLQSPFTNAGGTDSRSNTTSSQQDHVMKNGFPFQAGKTKEGAMVERAKTTSPYETGQILSEPIPEKRNLPIKAPLVGLETATHNGIKINRRANVELYSGDFLKVVDIINDPTTSEITLRGWLFRRTREMNGLLERKLNEVCWILHIDEDDQREPSIQGMVSCPITDVLRRRHVKMTNLPFPELSWRQDGEEPEEVISRDRVLVCRFKYICSYADTNARERNQWVEKALHRLRKSECDHSCSKEDEELRYCWRGETVKGGSSMEFQAGEAEFLELERQCHEISQTYHTPLSFPRFRPSNVVPSSMRRGSVGSLLGELDLLQTSDPSVRLSEREPDFPDKVALLNQNARKSDQGKCHSRACIDLTIDDFYGVSKASSSRTGNNSKASYRSFSSPGTRDSLEVAEIPPLVGSISRNPTHQREKAVHSFPNQTRRKRFMDQVPWNQHVPRKRIKADRSSRLLSHTSFNTASATQLMSDDQLTSSEDSRLVSIQEYSDTKATDFIWLRSPSPIDLTKDSTLSGNKYGPNPCAKYPNTFGLSPDAHMSGGMSTNLPYQSKTSEIRRNASRSATPQRYTFGDCFCGAGGTSRGAVGAGLRVEWGFDFTHAACKSYELNFYGARVYNIWAHQFSSLPDQDHKVDICHLSPPCQFFSDAHTILGKDDDMNVASLFAIFELLRSARPRVVTLEQTSGLLRRHPIFLNAVILMFTARGFSIRWRLLNCADFGLPQRRLRLFMIASW